MGQGAAGEMAEAQGSFHSVRAMRRGVGGGNRLASSGAIQCLRLRGEETMGWQLRERKGRRWADSSVQLPLAQKSGMGCTAQQRLGQRRWLLADQRWKTKEVWASSVGWAEH
jgi:hypothetical protein